MARPEKNTVEYFPFLCDDGKKMFYLEETYGNDGFATFVKILRELAKTDYHYLNLSKNTTLMFLSAKCKINKETLESIINDLVDLEKFDKLLWEENKIIWCQDFIDSIQDAYIKRKNKCITYDSLLLLLCSLGVRKPIKSKPLVPINPQTILEDTIPKDNILNIYDYKDFLNDWCLCRTHYLNKPTNLKLNTLELSDFNILAKDYIQKDFQDALKGLFKQENIKFKSMLLRPKHFLENFEKYYNAELGKDYELYGKKPKQDNDGKAKI